MSTHSSNYGMYDSPELNLDKGLKSAVADHSLCCLEGSGANLQPRNLHFCAVLINNELFLLDVFDIFWTQKK